ncbi:Calcineurin-like phosphoesterase [compost metagenome]
MGKIFFCGDTHGRFDHVIKAVREHRPAAVVFLGDLQPQRSLDQELGGILGLTEVWWIHGNHDTDSDADFDNLFGSALANRNLHGRVAEIAGVRVAGLGGIFRGQVWVPPAPARFEMPEQFAAQCGKGNLWRGGLPRKHRSSIFPSDYVALAAERAEILVTHEAPSCHPHGFSQIDELALSLGVRVSFHGHHHDRLDYGSHRRRLGFDAYGVGLCGITDDTGHQIRAGDIDALRNS